MNKILLGILIGICLISSIYSKDIPQITISNGDDSINNTGLVGYWRFENNALDYSGYANDGTVTGATYTSSGRFGGAYDFDGDTDYIKAFNSSSLNITDEITLSTWVNLDNLLGGGSGSEIIRKGDSYLLRVGTSGVVTFYLAGVDDTTLTTTDTLQTDTWYNIAGIYNTTHKIIYINGVQSSIEVTTGSITKDNKNLFIGLEGTTGTYDTNGTIDEVMVFNRSLSTSEIQLLYGTSKNYGDTITITATESNVNDTDVTYELFRNQTNVNSTDNGTATGLGAGYYYYTFNTTGGANYTNASLSIPVTFNIIASGLSLSSSPSFSTTPGTSVIVTCLGNSDRTLEKDSVTVANPFTASYTSGTYNFTCTMTDSHNYTPTTTQNNLTISSTLLGCTNVDTYAFNKTITPTGDNVSLNFTDLVSSNYIKTDLTDVWVNSSVVPNAWTNFTGGDSYLVVNVTGVSSFVVKFGNYIGNQSYTNVSQSENTTAITNYNQENDYYFLTFLDEEDVTQYVPSATNNTLTLFCPSGETSFTFNDTRILVSTLETLDEIRAKVEYSASSFYYRNILIDSPVELRNIYLVDAVETSVLQMIISLNDLTGDFDSSELKIKKNLESELVTITELNFDAEDKAIVYLINGDKYTLSVDNGVEERSIGFLYADSADLTKTITIVDLNITDITPGNISLNLSLGSIRFVWNDPSEKTNKIELFVYNYTDDTLLFSASSTNRSYIEFLYEVPVDNATYKIKYNIDHETYGNWSMTTFLSGDGAFIKPTSFPISDLITGMGGSARIWLSFLLILPVPLLFGRKYSGIAVLFTLGFIGLLVHWDVFPMDTSILLPLSLFVAVIVFIKWVGRDM